MKIGGGDYTEESIAEAEEMSRIVGLLMQGRRPADEEVYDLSDGRIVLTVKPDPELEPMPAPVLMQPHVMRDGTMTESTTPCRPTAHLWSKPTDDGSGTTVAECSRCHLLLRSVKAGSASEVMADLLQQIPQ